MQNGYILKQLFINFFIKIKTYLALDTFLTFVNKGKQYYCKYSVLMQCRSTGITTCHLAMKTRL